MRIESTCKVCGLKIVLGVHEGLADAELEHLTNEAKDEPITTTVPPRKRWRGFLR
jgi:hypothetical protein